MTFASPGSTSRRGRLWPFGVFAVALVAGICAISLAVGRPHHAEAASAAHVAAPVPPPADNPPADNPPARADKPSTPPMTGSTFAFDGTVELKPGQFRRIEQTGCTGDAGIGVGTPVTVTDARGAVVAVGRLDLANYTAGGGIGGLDSSVEDGTCDLQFTVAGIPIDRGYYGVEIAHRGAVKFSEASLRSGLLNLFVD
jgi:hypothetical protein